MHKGLFWDVSHMYGLLHTEHLLFYDSIRSVSEYEAYKNRGCRGMRTLS